MAIYAIVETGGKQYKVAQGQIIEVDRLEAEAGNIVELNRVLLVADGDEVRVGQPTVEGARVVASVLGEIKGKKIIIFKYKPKVRYRRKTGHRQTSTRLEIKDIISGIQGDSHGP